MSWLTRWFARTLILAGAVAMLWVGVTMVLAAAHRREAEEKLERQRSSAVARESKREQTLAPPQPLPGDPIGRLEIPRIGLSGVIVEGDQDVVLDFGIGHLPDTPLPWQPGNSAVAAHRDALFSPLKNVRRGDVVRLKTLHGDFDYRVSQTMIVKPDDLSVLKPTPVSTLTLISCYPFNFIGRAPKRFIVRAERIPAGDTASAKELALLAR